MTLSQGNHEFRIEYVEFTGQALISFVMTPLNVFNTPTPVPPSSDLHSNADEHAGDRADQYLYADSADADRASAAHDRFVHRATHHDAVGTAVCDVDVGHHRGAIADRVGGERADCCNPICRASGQAQHCPTEPGQKVYSLIITTSPYYGPVSATQIVQVIGPPTPTPTPAARRCNRVEACWLKHDSALDEHRVRCFLCSAEGGSIGLRTAELAAREAFLFLDTLPIAGFDAV